MPLSELLFVVEYNLAKEFPALSPFEIEDKAFFEIVDLYSDMRRMQIQFKKDMITDPDQETKTKVIRRPAGDDWF